MDATHTDGSETMTYEEIYKAARKNGDCEAAVRATMRAGLDCDKAVDLSWRIETGKPMPNFALDPIARAEWDAGYEQTNHGAS